ncbi:hypothetical protein ACGF0D_23750 [Kitasatospora sp. NPDC048298]|uniref:hypothetical protein n=1 Tax=Kitasatospora sp. NPDC048298 TaxID=3364049 RepID=UPI0037247CCC
MMGTARQVELLRAEIAKNLQAGLEQLRSSTDALRSELTTTLATGLSEHRDSAFATIAKAQELTERAIQENRTLRRQLGTARGELTAMQNTNRAALQTSRAETAEPAEAAPVHEETTAWSEAGTEGPEVRRDSTAPSAAEEHPPSADGSATAPSAGAEQSGTEHTETQAAEAAPRPALPSATSQAAGPDSKETFVTDPAADNEPVDPLPLTEEQVRRIVAEAIVGQLVDLLRPQPAPAEPEVEVEAEASEQEGTAPIAPSGLTEESALLIAAQLADLLRPQVDPVEPEPAPAAEPPAIEEAAGSPADDVSGLIPESFAWPIHVGTLRKAAAVRTVAISCHPETWDFLAAQIEDTEHFSKPVGGSDEDTILSGRSVIALLNALRRTAYNGVGSDSGIETWALAVTSYERIAAVINHTRPADEDGGSGKLAQPRIVLDDRIDGS